MHWAAHKHTAAEVIYQKADARERTYGINFLAGEIYILKVEILNISRTTKEKIISWIILN